MARERHQDTLFLKSDQCRQSSFRLLALCLCVSVCACVCLSICLSVCMRAHVAGSGFVVGHIYFFLEDVYAKPRAEGGLGGPRLLKAPAIL